MEEIWRDIPGFEGKYQISNLGNLKTVNSMGERRECHFRKNPSGYLQMTTHLYLHRLVAKLFIPNPDNLPVVNHKDGDKTNNCVDNLEWVTQSENVRKAYETGQAKPTENQRQAIIKTNHLKRKKVRQYDKEGNLIREFKSVREASEELNITSSMVSLIANGKRKSNKYFLKY